MIPELVNLSAMGEIGREPGADGNVIPLPLSRTIPRIYRGFRAPATHCCVVTVSVEGAARALDPRLDLANHSPTGFEWGYLGSGPAQLALAMLADALANDERALKLYQRFKLNYVANLKRDEPWAISDADVGQIAQAIECAATAHAGGS